MFGIGGVVTFKNSGLDRVVSELPLERLVLETDCPYLAPHPYRGSTNEPKYTRLVAEKIALIKGISYDTVIRETHKNALNLFKKANNE